MKQIRKKAGKVTRRPRRKPSAMAELAAGRRPTAKRPIEREKGEPAVQLKIRVPRAMKRALKEEAARRETTIQEIIIAALQKRRSSLT